MNNPLFYIFSIITIVGCLIYNEIIIIKICNLNYNTRNEIINRQISDFYNGNNNDFPMDPNEKISEGKSSDISDEQELN